MIADITLNCKSKCINSHTSFASLFHFSFFYFLPFVEDAQCQQHGAVEQHAYGKYKLKITPLRIGCGAKAQHAQMPQPVGNGNRNCPLYAAADMQAARKALMAKFDFTQEQAQAIIDMRLRVFTEKEREKLKEEQEELQNELQSFKQ